MCHLTNFHPFYVFIATGDINEYCGHFCEKQWKVSILTSLLSLTLCLCRSQVNWLAMTQRMRWTRNCGWLSVGAEWLCLMHLAGPCCTTASRSASRSWWEQNCCTLLLVVTFILRETPPILHFTRSVKMSWGVLCKNKKLCKAFCGSRGSCAKSASSVTWGTWGWRLIWKCKNKKWAFQTSASPLLIFAWG